MRPGPHASNLETFMRSALIFLHVVVLSLWAGLAVAQETPAPAPDRSATGGAQTLEDIMARQRGEPVELPSRDADSAAGAAAALVGQLGTRGGSSDSDLWSGLRQGSADITSTNRGPASTVLIQDNGMAWLTFREGPLLTYGLYTLGGTIGALVLFFLLRGRIKIDGERTGRTIQRFKGIERFGHWLLATSFIILGITGLIVLAGRKFLIPWMGHESYALIAVGSKWVHNNISWAFMLALVIIFVTWVWHNLPDRTDLYWIIRGGGILGGGHPPAKKFNAGQKVIFWSCIVLGGSISVSGISLLFPFEFPMFAPTFEKLNAFGIPQALGFGELRTVLAPHEEMQLASAWHAMVSFALMAIILAHIYIGSVGMEGAFDAMGSGEVEEQWAREHHSLWVEEVEAKRAQAPSGGTPAE